MESQVELPPLISVTEISNRLKHIFPKGTPNRNYVTRELAAKTVFVMLYAGAVENRDSYMRPDQVVRMNDSQSRKRSEAERKRWAAESLKSHSETIKGRWYATNTREPIRDETLRQGLVTLNAVIERKDLPTTSSKPRYTLHAEFADLFSPRLKGRQLTAAVKAWRENNLSAAALARTELVRQATTASENKVQIKFPNGESRLMEPGPSSIISKAVIEVFAPRFLSEPSIIWLSESGNKVVARYDSIANSIGLTISPDRHLPDLILADLGRDSALLVFVEVVASDGEITEDRKDALEQIAINAGFNKESVAFVTAFLDRGSTSFRKCISTLAWRSFAWFAAEPENLIALHDGSQCRRLLGEYMG